MKKVILLLLSTIFIFNILYVLQSKFLEKGLVELVSPLVNPATTFLLIIVLGLVVVFEGIMFSLLMIVVGSVYGLYTGLVIGFCSVILGMSVSFLSVRHFGHGDFLVRKKKGKDLSKLQRIINKDYLEGLWLVHILPLLPNPLYVVACAMSKIKYMNFILLSIIGAFPYMLVAVSLGSESLQGSVVAIFVYGFLISGALSIVFFRREIKHHFIHV